MDGHFHSSVTSELFCRQDTLYVKDFVTGLVLTFPFWKPVEDLPTAKALEPKRGEDSVLAPALLLHIQRVV